MESVKTAAAERWVKAVNADGRYGRWLYEIVHRPEEVRRVLDAATEG
jgi:type III restriction enzyme